MHEFDHESEELVQSVFRYALDRLRNQRVDELIAPENKKYLTQMRYNIEAVSGTLKFLGRTLRQRGIDLHQIILEASGDWDEEDEQKYGDCPAAAFYQKNTRKGTIKIPIGDDDVVAARKGDVRSGKGEGLELQVRKRFETPARRGKRRKAERIPLPRKPGRRPRRSGAGAVRRRSWPRTRRRPGGRRLRRSWPRSCS